jgi:O-antigen/teichoic acid export membrane protein
VIGGAAIAAAWAIPLVDRGRYPLSVPIFQILLAVAFVGYLLLPTSGLLIAQKRYMTLAWVNASALAVNVVAAVIAAPLMGVIGVAVAGTVVGIAQAGTVAYLALRKRESAPPKPSDEGLVRKVESVTVAADANAASSRGKAAG